MIKLHLGSGYECMDGWTNIDYGISVSRPDFVQWDLTRGLPPSIADNSVDFIFSQHFLEHLTREHGGALLKACYRKLKPGGVIRTSVPDLDGVIDRYLKNELPTGGPGAYAPPNRCVMVNIDFRGWGHQFLYNRDELTAAYKEAGFNTITYPEWRVSQFVELNGIDFRRPDDLIIEGVK